MTSDTMAAHRYAPAPDAPPIDTIPIMLTIHLLGLVMGMAAIMGLIPVAIVLVRALI